MKNKWSMKFVIFVFLLSTFSNSAFVTSKGFAEGDNRNSALIPDKAQTVEFATDSEVMNGFFTNPAVLLEKDGKKYIQMSGKSGDMIKTLSVAGQEVIRTESDSNGIYTFQFELANNANLSDKLDFDVNVEAGNYKHTYSVKLWFEDSTLQDTTNNYLLLTNGNSSNNEEVSDDSSNNDNNIEEDKDEESMENDQEPNEPNDNESSEENEADKDENAVENDQETNDNGSSEEKEEDNSNTEITDEETSENDTDQPSTIDSAYTLSYTTEGANIAGSYDETAYLLEKDGKQYIQLQGKSMRQFIEFLYIDGKKMAISPAIDQKGAYLAQFELPKPLEQLTAEENKFTFDMIINARGKLMSHKTDITFDLLTKEKVNKAEHSLVEDSTKPIDTNIVESNKKMTYSYTTEGAKLDNYYENKIDIIEKDGKQYMELTGKGMRQFVEALYVDGERMAIGPTIDENGLYKAQIELKESLADKNEFHFTMLINAMGRIMTHDTTIILDEEVADKGIDLADGEYMIAFDALYQEENKPSTAGKYLVNPTKLTVKDGKAKLFLKLTDHEVIKDLKVEKDGEFVSAEVISENEKANTRIVAFDIDNLTDEINAQVKVFVAQTGYTSEQPFRIVLTEDSIKEYDGSLEKDDSEKPSQLEDGLYTINYRVLEENEFKKSDVGNLMKAPANLKIDGDKKIVTITLKDDESITDFQIEKDGKFEKANVVKTDSKNNTRDIRFEIDSLDAVVKAKVSVTSQQARSTQEDVVRLFFEENSVQLVETNDEDGKEDEKAEDKEDEKEKLVADQAYTLGYKILHKTKDEPSSADSFFTGQAVLLEHNGEEYIQITTTENSAHYFKSFQNKLNGNFEEMVVVERTDNDAITFQFKLDRPLTINNVVELYMELDYFGNGQINTHEARLIFDTSKLEPANPEEYRLVASTNANGPDGENAQTPGKGEENNNDNGGKTPEPTPKPKPKPSKPENAIDTDEAYKVNYVIKHETEDKESVANPFFTGEAYILHVGNEKYAQIATKDGSGNYIDSFRNKVGKKYEEMVVVDEKTNGDKVLQFKLNGSLSDVVLLDMVITVPGVYEGKNHKARLFFDTTNLTEVDASKHYVIPSTNANGPDGKGAVTPTPNIPGETNTKNGDSNGSNDNGLGKPEFGDGQSSGESAQSTGETTNPKTSDRTKIYLYALLLVAAGGGLFLQLRKRKRFAKE